jgi:predicted O-methyltransferase YrrM
MKEHAGSSFEKYAKTIQQFPTEYFDLVLVDGRARPSCIQQSLPYLKHGGLLVVDNTERSYYLEPFTEILKSEFDVLEDRMAPVSYTPDFTRTSIFRRRVK